MSLSPSSRLEDPKLHDHLTISRNQVTGVYLLIDTGDFLPKKILAQTEHT